MDERRATLDAIASELGITRVPLEDAEVIEFLLAQVATVEATTPELQERVERCTRILKFQRGDPVEPKVHFGEGVLLPVGGGGL